LEAGSAFRVPTFRNYLFGEPSSGFTLGLGSASEIVHLNHKLKHKSNIHLSKHSSLSRSPIIASRMSKHYKVVLNKVLFLKKLLCPKAKVLKDNVSEMKAIL
jgi:hypothetical protein